VGPSLGAPGRVPGGDRRGGCPGRCIVGAAEPRWTTELILMSRFSLPGTCSAGAGGGEPPSQPAAAIFCLPPGLAKRARKRFAMKPVKGLFGECFAVKNSHGWSLAEGPFPAPRYASGGTLLSGYRLISVGTAGRFGRAAQIRCRGSRRRWQSDLLITRACSGCGAG
jgi:hypothetical protein